MDLIEYIESNQIKQINISSSLKDHESAFFGNINFNKYINNYDNTLFWGMYNKEDIDKVISHNGNKWVYWYDNDCSPYYKNRCDNVNKIKLLNIKEHLCSNNIAKKYLNKHKIYPNLLNLTYNDSSSHDSCDKFSQTINVSIDDTNDEIISNNYEDHIYNEINSNESTKCYRNKYIINLIVFVSGLGLGALFMSIPFNNLE